MSESGGWPGASPLLSGLFGSLQQAAINRLPTADLWRQLRIDAGTWAWQTAGKGDLPDNATLESQGADILRAQGVGVREVNAYRAVASEWRSAKENLHSTSPEDQLTGREIFQPPWAQTVTGPVEDRYRVRVQWEVSPESGDAFTTWGSYELSSPLTSLSDLLDQAGQLVGKKPTSGIPLGAVVTGAADYELEQI